MQCWSIGVPCKYIMLLCKDNQIAKCNLSKLELPFSSTSSFFEIQHAGGVAVTTLLRPSGTGSSAHSMAFHGIRFHDSIGFADSSTQDMSFWRQRVDRENARIERPSQLFTSANMTLQDLPRNPFQNSAGMLYGRGTTARAETTPLGLINPDLAAYRATVPSSPMARQFANGGTLPFVENAPDPARSAASRPYWQIPKTPNHYGHHALGAADGCVSDRVARGAARLEPIERLPTRPPNAFEKHLLVEAPRQNIGAPMRKVMGRARLDARMYAPSPG